MATRANAPGRPGPAFGGEASAGRDRPVDSSQSGIPATMALWMAVAWWYWARRRSHWLVLAALCAALAVTPLSPDQRWDAGLLLMCAGMALQGLLDHFEMIRLVQPLPEELDGHRV